MTPATLVESEGFCGVLIPLNWSWFPIWKKKQESSSRHHLNSKTTFKWFKQYHMIQKLYLIDSKITLHNKLRYHKKNCTELLLRVQPRFFRGCFEVIGRSPQSTMEWREMAMGTCNFDDEVLVRRNWRKSGEQKSMNMRAQGHGEEVLKFCWTSALSLYIGSISYYDIFCAIDLGCFFLNRVVTYP